LTNDRPSNKLFKEFKTILIKSTTGLSLFQGIIPPSIFDVFNLLAPDDLPPLLLPPLVMLEEPVS
jgi:hypothetical protein